MSTQPSCLDCPHCVRHGAVLLRSCSLVRDGVQESSAIIECEVRPELGLFEPFRGSFKCPLADVNKKYVTVPVD